MLIWKWSRVDHRVLRMDTNVVLVSLGGPDMEEDFLPQSRPLGGAVGQWASGSVGAPRN